MTNVAPDDETDFDVQEISAWDDCDPCPYTGEFAVNTTVRAITGPAVVLASATKKSKQQRSTSKLRGHLQPQRCIPFSKSGRCEASRSTIEPSRQSPEECSVESRLSSSNLPSTTLERVPMPALNDPTSPLAQPLTVYHYRKCDQLMDDGCQQPCTTMAPGVECPAECLPHLRVKDDAVALCVEGESRWPPQHDVGTLVDKQDDYDKGAALPSVNLRQKQTETFSTAKAEWIRRLNHEEPRAENAKTTTRRRYKNDKTTVSSRMQATRRGSDGCISSIKASFADASWQQKQRSVFAHYVVAISAPRRLPLPGVDGNDEHAFEASCRLYKEHSRLG